VSLLFNRGDGLEWLKPVHITCAVLSFSGFFLRGIWMLQGSSLVNQRWVKIFPHVIDTLLLVSALIMLYVLHLSVIENNWLLAKIGALLIYIALGMLALKYGKNKRVRGVAWVSGLLVFMYIVSVALTKSILGFINWI